MKCYKKCLLCGKSGRIQKELYKNKKILNVCEECYSKG